MRLIKTFVLYSVLFCVQASAIDTQTEIVINPKTQSWSLDSSDAMMSCRFYKKRFETFVQRGTEFHKALMDGQRKLTYEESLRLKDLAERMSVPLELNVENLVWGAVFELPAELIATNIQDADLNVEVDSSQLRISSAGLPALDEFSITNNGRLLRVRMRMGYWNACLLKNYLNVDFKLVSGQSFKISLDLAELF